MANFRFNVTFFRQLSRQVRPFLTKASNSIQISSCIPNYQLNSAKMASTCSRHQMKAEENCGGKTRLAILDFDCTIIQFNTDDVVQKLLPSGPITRHEIPYIKAHGWTKFMGKVFRLLHEARVTPEEIKRTICGIDPVPGMTHFVRTLHDKHDFEIIIVSDANSVFINDWLYAHQMHTLFNKIYTNPSRYNEGGLLNIEPFHHQTDCKLSPPNMCKGKILDAHVTAHLKAEAVKFKQIIYVGDGDNDICPGLRLKLPTDLLCAREGYDMAKLLKKSPEKYPLTAQLVVWKDGYNLLDQVEKLLL